jgi:hypothetical protein
MAADEYYGEFDDIYSVSPEYFVYTLVSLSTDEMKCMYTSLSGFFCVIRKLQKPWLSNTWNRQKRLCDVFKLLDTVPAVYK